MKVIELTQGRVAIVDDEDFERLAQWRWSYCSRGLMGGYAKRSERVNGRTKTIYMHKEILSGFRVDHRNENKLDNRRRNLRQATVSQNGMNRGKTKANTTGFKGVFQVTGSHKFLARIVLNRKPIHLGCFDTKEEAALAYNSAALLHHGEFAKLN